MATTNKFPWFTIFRHVAVFGMGYLLATSGSRSSSHPIDPNDYPTKVEVVSPATDTTPPNVKTIRISQAMEGDKMTEVANFSSETQPHRIVIFFHDRRYSLIGHTTGH